MKDKVVIVTGGTSGIGYEAAKKMAKMGAIVYAAARKERVFEEEDIRYHYLDVTDSESCRKLFDDIIKEHGRIDVLVADAGITADALTVKMTDEQFDRVIAVNLKGIFNIVRYVGPFMEKQGWGSIVNISSIVGEQGNIGQVNYSASKGAVISMTKTWANGDAGGPTPNSAATSASSVRHRSAQHSTGWDKACIPPADCL